jgi:signal transduction histidine kinase
MTSEHRAAQTLLTGSALFGFLVAGGFALVSFLERERRNGEQIFMLRTLSHELRTPLTAMTLAAETLRERFDALDERGQQDLLVMLAETQKLARVVRGSGQALLSAAQGRSGIQSLACVVEVVEAALEPFEAKIHAALPEGPVPFCTDPFWLGLCVSNLVRNAVIHGKPPVRATLVVKERMLIFSVEDAGTFDGLPGTRFAPFRRGSQSAGLGLGLSLVARKARDLGGKLEVRTRPTIFTFTLRNRT